MSKRGGSSEVNGFISLRSDDKKSTSRKEENVKKKETDGTEKRRKDTEATQDRSRMSEVRINKEPSKNIDKKDVKNTKENIKEKSDLKLSKKLDSKTNTKTSSSLVNSKRTSQLEKPTLSSKDVKRSYSDNVSKAKEHVSSPYLAGKSLLSNPHKKRQQSQLKDSPYNSSIAQKSQPRTSIQASGDRLKKTSQLKETHLKSKTTSVRKTAMAMGKMHSKEPSKHKIPSDSSSKPKTATLKKGEKSVASIPEETVTQSRPFGEIPRSNTFTKEEVAPNSLVSDVSVSQEYESVKSLGPDLSTGDEQDDVNEYNYDDDFEDYESDFEEYVESEGSSSTKEEESISESDSLDEDEVGDGYQAGSSGFQEQFSSNEKHGSKSILKNRNSGIPANDLINESQTEKEKPLTVEEERKLDSGSYDLTSIADLRRRKQIQDIRAAIDKENANITSQLNQDKSRLLMEDEGFVEVFSQETPSTFLDASQLSCDVGLIDFAQARKQQMKHKAKIKMRNRGAILMEMIKLDVIGFNLLSIPAVPYEVYMKCYGRSNTFQIHTQTNEDVINEEVQTDEIEVKTKWTQHPIKYSSTKSSDDLLFTFSQEKLGVGGESTVVDEEEKWFPKLHVNSLRLHNFINLAGEAILTVLEEYEQDRRFEVCKSAKKRDFGFSEGFTSLNVDKVDFLKGRIVSTVYFSESNITHILTVHKPSTQPLTVQAESEGRCVICTWSIREPSSPLHMLVASNDVTSVCFHSFLVFAGLIDGLICVWDLREQSVVHCRSFLNLPSWVLRSPTYISANLDKDKRHFSSVVSIKLLPESNPDDSAKTSNQMPTQIVSLDEDGLLVVWTIVETKSSVNIDSGLAPWGKVRLVQSSHIRVNKAFPKSVQKSVQCLCLAVDSLKPSNLYIGTNFGQVIHSLQTSTKTRPQFYSCYNDTTSRVTCIEFSKCGYPLFMVGDTAGKVRIYRNMTEKPLLDIAASTSIPGPPIKALQWSPTRPGLFFVLDANSSIHVWDLCVSDMCPQMTVPFTTQHITSISLTSQHCSRMLAVSTEAGTVNIFHLKTVFGSLCVKDTEEEKAIFNRYITIL